MHYDLFSITGIRAVVLTLNLMLTGNFNRKTVVGGLLCGGIFCIAATIIRIYLSLQNSIAYVDTTIWEQREEVSSPCVMWV